MTFWGCIVLWISTHVQFCVTITTIRIQTSSITPPPNLFCYPFVAIPFLYPNHRNYCSILHHYSFVFLRTSYKWNCVICKLLRLASFINAMSLSFPQVVVYISPLSCWLLGSGPLYGHTTVYPSPIEGHFTEGFFFLAVRRRDGKRAGPRSGRPVWHLFHETQIVAMRPE